MQAVDTAQIAMLTRTLSSSAAAARCTAKLACLPEQLVVKLTLVRRWRDSSTRFNDQFKVCTRSTPVGRMANYGSVVVRGTDVYAR